MKLKKILTLILIAALALTLCVGFAGCGGGGGESGEGTTKTGSGNAPGGAAAGTAAPAEDTYVYSAEYITLQGELGGFPNTLVYADGRFLTSVFGVVGDNTPEGVTPEYEGQYSVYGTIFYWLNTDGTIEKLANYEAVTAPDGPEAEDFEQNQMSFVLSYNTNPDGNLMTLEEVFVSWYDGPDDIDQSSFEWYSYQKTEEFYYLRTFDTNGTELSCIDITALSEDNPAGGGFGGGFGGFGGFGFGGGFTPTGFATDDAGNIFILGNSSIMLLDKDGNKVKEIEGNNAWFESITRLANGRVAVVSNEFTRQKMFLIDPATMELSDEETYTLLNANNMTVGGGDYDFYFTNGSNFMGYKLATGESDRVLNWINADVDPTYVSSALVLPDGRIATMETRWSSDFTSSTVTLILLTKVPASSLAQKTVLTMATQSLDMNMRSQIVKFNRNSPDTRIEVVDYSEYNTDDDRTAGLTKLNTEILAGNMPDLLDLNGLNLGQLAARGLLVDLYPYLNADSELNGHIFENVLGALESDGKLYRTGSSFSLYTVIGAASVVGEEPGWTLKDFEDALAGMPEGCEPFSHTTTRSTILNACLNMEMGNLVDWNSGECHFDSKTFTDILEFAALFPESVEQEGGFGGFGGGFGFGWGGFGGNTGETEENRIATGKQMLTQTWLYNFDSYQNYEAMFGGDATYVGFPTSEGVGNALMMQDSGYAATTKCVDKDAAWQFLRSLFTSDYQNSATAFAGFPTNRDAFQAMLDKAMTPEYEKDENGNYLLDENGERIEVTHSYWGWGSSTTALGALKQEQADEILALVTGIDRVWNNDQNIINVITAETEAYFAGQKSAEEVAKLAQSKLTIYVNEQR